MYFQPPGARDGVVTGLLGGAAYEFEVTALTGDHWQGAPVSATAHMPAAPSGVANPNGDSAKGDSLKGDGLNGGLKGVVVDPFVEPLRLPLRLRADAPAFCLGYQGNERAVDGFYERRKTRTVPVGWEVSGGRGPYEVRVGSVSVSGGSGVVELLCGRNGLDLKRLAEPEIDVLEPRTKVITVEAKDADGVRVTKTLAVEVIKDGAVGPHPDWFGTDLRAGSTYFVHDRVFFDIPEGGVLHYNGEAHAYEEDDGLPGYTTYIFIRVSGGASFSEGWIGNDLRTHRGPYLHDGRMRRWDLPHDDPEDHQWWGSLFDSVRYTPFTSADSRSFHVSPLAKGNLSAGEG